MKVVGGAPVSADHPSAVDSSPSSTLALTCRERPVSSIDPLFCSFVKLFGCLCVADGDVFLRARILGTPVEINRASYILEGVTMSFLVLLTTTQAFAVIPV